MALNGLNNTTASVSLTRIKNASEVGIDGELDLDWSFVTDSDSNWRYLRVDIAVDTSNGTAKIDEDYKLYYYVGNNKNGIKQYFSDGESITITEEYISAGANTIQDALKIYVEPIDDSIYDPEENVSIDLLMGVYANGTDDNGRRIAGRASETFTASLNLEDEFTANISNYTPVIYETAADFGDAASFDGVDDYVEVSANQNPTNAITVEAWAKSDTTTWNSNGSLVSKRDAFILHPQQNSRDIRFYIHNGSQWYSVLYTPDSKFDITQWHHYAGTYDGVTLRFYVDGQEVSTSEINAGAINLDNDVLTIGRDDGLNRYFDGQIDEVRIWETARTQEDIQENLYAKLDGTENDLVAYYNFDEDSVDGNTIADITENGNNGTFTNGDGDNFDPSLSFIGYVDIELDEKVTNQPGIILNYQIESDSTATQDEDFYNSQTDVSTTDGEPQTDSIFIAEGEDSARIYLTALPDAVVEGDENIKLTLLPDFYKALDLDGVDDYLKTNNLTGLNTGNQVHTIEQWVYLPELPSGRAWLSLLGQYGTGSHHWLVHPDGEMQIGVYGRSNGQLKPTLNVGEWTHLATVYDVSDDNVGTLTLYVNGEEYDSTSANFNFTNTEFNLGVPLGSDPHFKGKVDEVRIWNTARTKTEIKENYKKTLTGLETDLVAYYNFNQNKALLLDGNNDYVEITNSDGGFADFGPSQFSIELWFKTDDNDGVLIGSGDTSANFWQVYIEDGKANFNFDTGGNANAAASSDNAVNDGQWHHLVAIRDGIKSGKLYIDGEQVDTLTLGASTSSIEAHTNVYIGRYDIENNNYFAGEIDEIKIWNYALSATEVEKNYSTTNFDKTDSNLKAYYTFDDSNTNDLSSSNDGTVNGGIFVESGIFPEQNFTNSLVYDPFATNGPTYSIGTSQSAEIRIQDSDAYTKKIIIADEYGDEVSDTDSVVVDENGDAKFKIKLGSQPTSDVTINLSTSQGSLNQSSFTFNDSNWDTYEEFTLSGLSSSFNDFNVTATLSGNDTNYSGNQSITITDSSDNIKLKVTEGGAELELTPTVSITATSDATEGNEKESGVFTISLDTPAPDGGLVIPISVSSTATEGTNYNLYANSFTYSGESALSFDGVDDYVETNNLTGLNTGNQVHTIEQWVYLPELPSGRAWLSLLGQYGTGSHHWLIHSDGEMQIGVYNSSGGQLKPTLNVGEWTHLATVYNVSDDNVGTLTLYINGEEYGSTSATFNFTNTEFKLGLPLRSDPYFKGQVDEVRIWNTARSETEIKDNLYQKLEGTEEGLVAYYNFDDVTTIIPDVTENGNDATPYIGQGLSLDGSSEYVEIGDVNELDFGTKSFTVEAWVYDDPDSINGWNNAVAKKANFNTASGWTLRIGSQDKPQFFLADGTNRVDLNSGTVITEGEWYHLAGVVNRDTNEAYLYINGELAVSESIANLGSISSSTGLKIGSWGALSNYWHGQIDEVRIWNQARTSEQIQDNLYKKLEGTEDGLAAYYNFDSDVDTTINDFTGNGFDGRLVNGDSSNLTTSNIGYTLNDWEVTKTPVVKIAEGETQATITVSKIDNEIAESTAETVTVTLNDSADYNLDTNNQTATVNLNDDDEPGIEFAKLTTSNNTVVATSLEYYNNTLVTSEVATIELEVTSDFEATSDYANGNLGLKIASGSDSYTLTAGTELRFSDGAVVTVDTDTTISTNDAGTSVAVTFTADSEISKITTDETADIELSGEDSTTFAVRLSSQPTDTVTLDLAIRDTTEGAFASSASSQTLTFSTNNWDIYQEVTVYGVDDSEDDDNVEYSIDVTASSSDSDSKYNQITNSITVNNLDNDEPIEEVSDTSNSSSIVASLSLVGDSEITEGSTGQLKVTLSEAAPAGGLKVRYAVSGGTATPDEDFVDLQGFVERAYDSDENPLSQAHIGVFNFEETLEDFKLVDLDSDGDLDAVLIRQSITHYYKNNGNSSFPDFEELTGTDNPFDNISGESIAFGDLNGDTKPDVLLLNNNGDVFYYENTTQNASDTPSFTLKNTVISNSDINQITLVNIDGDENGNKELFASLDDGTISYYEQTSTTPTFVENSNANLLSSFSSIYGNRVEVVPNFVDYNSDGDVDVFIGMSGDFTYYENTADANNPNFIERTGSDNPFNSLTSNYIGDSSHPFLTDIDNDGDIDAFIAYQSFQPQIQIGYYENTFFQEVEIAEGATTATIDITTIADNIAEDDKTIEVSLSAKPSQSYTLEVTRGWTDAAFNLGTIELQIIDSETEVVGLPSGTELTFEDDNGNQVVFTVYDSVSVFSQKPTIVNGTSRGDTRIIAISETTDLTDEGYRLVEDSATPFTSTVSIIDDDVAGITISEDTDGTTPINTPITTSEDGSTETFYVSLDTKPTDNVAVYVGVENSQEGLLSDADESNENLVKLAFSPNNWDTSQAVTLTSVDDNIDDGDVSYNIITTVISEDIKYNEDKVVLKITEDFDYVPGSTNTISLLVDDLSILETELTAKTQLSFANGMVLEVDSNTTLSNSESTAVSVTQITAANQILTNATALIDNDGDNSTEYVKLIVTEAYADDVLELQIDEDSTVTSVDLSAGQKLTFSNGAVFTLDSAVTLSNSAADTVNGTINSNLLKVAITEVSVNATAQVSNGEAEVFVTTAYDANAGTIGLQIDNTSAASSIDLLAGTQIEFSNGAAVILDEDVTLTTSASIVNVSGIGNEITTNFAESISPDISVTNNDNDTAAVIVDKYDISSSEGYANNFFNVKLATKPVGEVSVTMNPVDANREKDYNISLADEFDGESYSVTFDETNWNLAKAVKVTAVDDYDIEYNHSSYIDFKVSSDDDSAYNAVTPPDDVIIKIEDNDLPVASIQAVAAATEAGSPGYFIVSLDNPAPDGFDGTGIVVNYSVSGTVDVNGSGETDDLKPITGSVRIAPGETRSPIIAFPIDDFKVESIPLKVVSFNGTDTVTLQINTENLSNSQLQNLIEVGTVTLDNDTELTFSGGAIATVDGDYTLQIDADGSINAVVEFTSDITTVATNETTSIPKEAVVVTLSSGSDYSINKDEPPSAILSIQDNDTPGVRIVEIGDTTVVKEDGTAEFYISLLSQPEADVTVSLNGISTNRDIVVDQAYSSGATAIQLKVNDSEVDSLFLQAGTTLGNITVSNDTTIFSDRFTEVAVSSLSSNVSAGESFTYSYTELGFEDTYTFNSNNWYKLQTVTVKGIDDNVAEKGDFHSSTVEYTFNTDDSVYANLEVAPQTINIIDRTFDKENTTESLIEGFLALQDGLDSVTLPIIGNLDGVAPSFIEDFIGDLVDEIKQTEYVTAQTLQDAFNNVLSGRFGTVEVEITDLSKDNIEFLVGIEDSLSESISLDGDLGLPALGIGIESDGSLDANFNYDIDLAFGINIDDGFYLNTEDTGFEVTTDFGLSDNFTATGNLSFLQLDVKNGSNVGGTDIDAEFVISLEDNNDSNGDNSQLTLSELNSLRKSDELFDSIKYGFSGDAALDLDVITSVKGNTGFPSFTFNLSSELPLFNYSNADDEEEVSDAILKVSNGLTSTEGSSIILNVTSNDNTSIIQLNKGTELKFGDDSVILTKTAYIQTGDIPTTIYAKVADDGDNNQTESVTIADGAEAELVSGDFNISFNEITLDLGGFITDLMSPIINYVNDLIEPFEPIIDVLQTEIELLDTLDLVDTFDENGDGSATLIEVASTLASTYSGNNLKYQQFFSAVTGIIDLVESLEELESSITSGDNLSVDFGDYTLENFKAASNDKNEDASNYDTEDSDTSNLNENTKNQAKTAGSGDLGTKISNFFSKLDELGIDIPLLDNPFTAINLFLGKDIDLVTYDIPELDINFEIEQEFPIFASIKGLLEGGFSISSDLLVGFDTNGLSQWEEEGFDLDYSYLILDGFYLSDVDPDTGEDVDELTLDATIAAGVSASAVVAKAEVKGGITGTAGLDITDGGEFTGTSDGKLRGSEILEADSLFDLFTLSGSLEAFIKAVVKVGVDLGFYEVMKTVWKEKFSVTLFEFELGSTSGTVSQSYIEDATVFFDANLNGIFEEGEPFAISNADGSYNLDVPLLFFDTNDNGKIDPEEGRIVTNGGIDTSSGVTLATPLIAPYGAKMVTPLTTIKQKLIEYGVVPEEAEQLIKEVLDLPDINLEEFDPLLAMSKGDERGTKVYKAHVQIQSLFTQVSEFIKGFDLEELEDNKLPIPQQAIDAIAKIIRDRKDKPPIDFSDSPELEELIKEPLEGKFKQISGEEAERLPQLVDILAQTIASANKEIDEVFKDVPPEDILEKVAPVKQVTQDKLPKELRKLIGGARKEDVTRLLERVPDAEQFLIDKQSQPGDKPPIGNDDTNPLPVVDSEDDTIIPIAPRKPKKLARGKRPRNLLELDGDDLSDTKIKFSLSSKNLTPGRIHEIAIFTTEDEEGTINGLSQEDEGYKQAVINKARSIFSILPDDFIANPQRIMKGFTDKNVGFLLIQNGTLDSVRSGKTSLDSVLLGTEKQGDGFRAIQMSEVSENSFRLSFEDELSNADFTDIVIDAELTDETPEIGTDTQGQSEGEMLDLRNYAGKQIKIEAPIVREESAYENVVGFYIVENETGAVSDPLTGNLLNPGEEGYIKAALRNSQNNAFQMGENGLSGSIEIAGGQILAPFIIADGTLEQVLDENPNNDPEVYFAYMSANSDGVDHIRNLGGNTWGFEDLAFGGDSDFNDVVVQLDTSVI